MPETTRADARRRVFSQAGTSGAPHQLFRFHSGGLDDRPPFLVVLADFRVELLRRTADRLRAELGQPFLDGVGIESRDKILRKLCQYIGRYSGRSEQAPPDAGVIA